jgi:uncharacterized protein YkwD
MTSTPTSRFTKLASAVVLASVTFSGLPAAQAAPAPVLAAPRSIAAVPMITGTAAMDGFEAEVLRLTNKARSKSRKCGSKRMKKAKKLRWDSTLATTANAHSTDMATRDYFSHYAPGGVSPFQRMRAAGYKYRAAGENIAAGRSLSSPEAVVRAWLKSPAHCRVLMNRKYRELGVGRVEGAGKWTVYWTQNFGRPR